MFNRNPIVYASVLRSLARPIDRRASHYVGPTARAAVRAIQRDRILEVAAARSIARRILLDTDPAVA